MTTSKEVTRLRKAGELDAAYQLSLRLIASSTVDNWDRAAYGWCLVSLAKKAAEDGNKLKLKTHLNELQDFEVPADNELLIEHREKALYLDRADRQAVMEAKQHSKQGHYIDALIIYANLYAKGELQLNDKKSWGWDLYKFNKEELQKGTEDKILPASAQIVKRNLNTYLKLELKEPDLLHSLLLRQALQLAKEDHLQVLPFFRLWGPHQFRDEDFKSETGQDGKSYPSLAERTLKIASSNAIESNKKSDVKFILPHLTSTLDLHPQNIWLKLNLIKLLRILGEINEARKFAIEFAREKANEYWAWEMVGDIHEDDLRLQLSCYARALSCSQKDDFVYKVRIKFSKHLVEDYPEQARWEIEQVLRHREQMGYRIPEEVKSMSESAWFSNVEPLPTGPDFYRKFTDGATALLFSHLPWNNGSLGDVFTIKGKDGNKSKSRRRIYIAPKKEENSKMYSVDERICLEVSLPNKHPDICHLTEGEPLQIKYEISNDALERPTIHLVEQRLSGSPFDVVPKIIGIIDHVNVDKSVIHVIVSRSIDGICPISAFPGTAKTGTFVEVQITVHPTPNGNRTRIISINPTKKLPNQGIYCTFKDQINVTESGLGFTEGDVFVPPNIVAESNIKSGDIVTGMAIINYNKKKHKWGLKAFKAIPLISLNTENS